MSPKLNRLEMFNEVCTLFNTYFLIVFTDYVEDRIVKYNVGYGLVLVVIINMVVNLSLIVGSSAMDMYK